jgi:hypothetical protein
MELAQNTCPIAEMIDGVYRNNRVERLVSERKGPTRIGKVEVGTEVRLASESLSFGDAAFTEVDSRDLTSSLT